MTDQLTSFKTSVLAKEKRFDVVTYAYYEEDGKLLYSLSDDWREGIYDISFNFNEISLKKIYYSAPTQTLLQTWLRDVHNIFVYVENSNGFWNWVIETAEGYIEGKYIQQDEYPRFEAQLEIGLYEALKLIN